MRTRNLGFDLSRLQSYADQILCRSLEVFGLGIPREVKARYLKYNNTFRITCCFARGSGSLESTWILRFLEGDQLEGYLSLIDPEGDVARAVYWEINEEQGILQVKIVRG